MSPPDEAEDSRSRGSIVVEESGALVSLVLGVVGDPESDPKGKRRIMKNVQTLGKAAQFDLSIKPQRARVPADQSTVDTEKARVIVVTAC